MGERGPAPKRSDQKHGHRTAAERAQATKAPAGEAFDPPSAGEGWHDIARRWYESLGRSGQSAFYEESDWLTAFAVAESMSREFKPQPIVVGKGEHAEVVMHELPPKAASLTAWLKAAGDLLATEGNRRRVALELERPKPEEGGDVSHLDDARQRLRGA